MFDFINKFNTRPSFCNIMITPFGAVLLYALLWWNTSVKRGINVCRNITIPWTIKIPCRSLFITIPFNISQLSIELICHYSSEHFLYQLRPESSYDLINHYARHIVANVEQLLLRFQMYTTLIQQNKQKAITVANICSMCTSQHN